MVTAVDTNILLDVITSAVGEVSSLAALRRAATEGPVLLSSVCYSEISANYRNAADFDLVLAELAIKFSPINREAAFLAGHFHRNYRERGGSRNRIIPDFLIAAHAQIQANRLLTRDNRFFGPTFPDLAVISP